MSKQSEARQSQGYSTDPQNCGNCKHRTCERRLPDWMVSANGNSQFPRYTVERDGKEMSQRCSLGGFAIKKTASCNYWEAV